MGFILGLNKLNLFVDDVVFGVMWGAYSSDQRQKMFGVRLS